MSFKVADRVKETSTTTGTGTITLLGAIFGYQSFASVGDTNETCYCIKHQSANEWEVGMGTYTASGTTLSRTQVIASSNSNSLVNFSAGIKEVFVTAPSSKTALHLPKLTGFSIPSGVGWDSVNYAITPGLYNIASQERSIGTAGLSANEIFDAWSSARTSPGITYYVSTSGNDSNSGTSSGSALRSIWKAIEKANTAALTARVYVAAGTYERAYGLSNNGTPVIPVRDIVFIATGVVHTGGFNALTYSADATYTNTYSVTRSNVNAVVDLLRKDEYGRYVELTYVPTNTRCNITPWSWSDNGANTTLWVHRGDGVAVADANTRTYLNVANTGWIYTSASHAPSIYFGVADNTFGYWTIQGGNGFMVEYSTQYVAPSTRKAIVMSNVAVYNAGGRSAGNTRGMSFESYYGIVALFNCRAVGNSGDGFNFHNVNGYNAGTQTEYFKMMALTVNCDAHENGRGSGSSNNGFTLHENVVGIDIGGNYERNRGGTIRSVQDSKQYLLGTRVKNDLGDVINGGTLEPVCIMGDDNCLTYLEEVKLLVPSGMVAMYTIGSAQILKRNIHPHAGLEVGTLSSF